LLQNQTRQAFLWLFRVALVALYYGRFAYARYNVRTAITDGDDDMIVALSGAFDLVDNEILLWGSLGNPVRLRRCYFHLFSLNFNHHYKSFKYSDGGVGKQTRDAFKYAAHHAESEKEFLHAMKAIRKFVSDHDVVEGQFKPAAQIHLLAWLDARMCDYKTYARYVVYGLVDDLETTTNVNESAHHRLKKDPVVNNKAELRILVRSDIHAVSQLYTEHKVAHENRILEVSTSRIPIEVVARSHLVKRGADAVLKSFLDSKNYHVGACEQNSDGCALVWRVFPEETRSKLPFRFDRGPRMLRILNGRLLCPCPYFCATQLVCPHILAYNEGKFGPEDVHPRHLKKYYVDSQPDCSVFQGCVVRRSLDAAFVALPEHDGGAHVDADADDQHQEDQRDVATKTQRGHMYTLLNQKSRELVEKWSSVPVAATKLMNLLMAFDSEMGDPSNYRIPGAASSRPTRSNGA
jgi:hypothetical protein